MQNNNGEFVHTIYGSYLGAGVLYDMAARFTRWINSGDSCNSTLLSNEYRHY
jgi:hypothetical protein